MHTMKFLVYIAAWFVTKARQIRRIPGLIAGSYRIIRKAPIRVQIILVLFVLYLVSPLDVVPNFIPVIGVLDDILVLALMGRYIYRHVPALAEYWGLPAPKPSRKQRIIELELTVASLASMVDEQDGVIKQLRFENDSMAEGWDDIFERANLVDPVVAFEQHNDL